MTRTITWKYCKVCDDLMPTHKNQCPVCSKPPSDREVKPCP